MSKAYIQSEQIRQLCYQVDLFRLALEIAAKDGLCPDEFSKRCSLHHDHVATCSQERFEKCVFNNYLREAVEKLEPDFTVRIPIPVEGLLKPLLCD